MNHWLEFDIEFDIESIIESIFGSIISWLELVLSGYDWQLVEPTNSKAVPNIPIQLATNLNSASDCPFSAVYGKRRFVNAK